MIVGEYKRLTGLAKGEVTGVGDEKTEEEDEAKDGVCQDAEAPCRCAGQRAVEARGVEVNIKRNSEVCKQNGALLTQLPKVALEAWA